LENVISIEDSRVEIEDILPIDVLIYRNLVYENQGWRIAFEVNIA
jgi:hypothetical protein